MATTLDETINRQTYSPVSWLLSRQTFWVFIAAVVACLVLSMVTDTFATRQNIFNVTRNFSFIAIAALGVTTVIITGGIDLSVGSVMGLSAVILGITMNAGYSIWAGIGGALAAALAVGLFNGLLIAYVRMPPFVVTLGMLVIARSLGQVASNNKMVFQFGPDGDKLLRLGGGSYQLSLGDYAVNVPNPVIALVLLAALTGFLLRWTRWGCHVFAVGGNEKAARLTGVPVRRIKISVYVFSAVIAGIAGVLMAGWLGGVTQNLGEGAELRVIAATVIGGANLMGGSGTAIGGIVGAALIEVIRNSLTLLGISTFWQGTFIGSCILVAVMLHCVRGLRETED
ncbi:MAG TPA: ABC transporter permease [Candidatus Acidoferrum sp.]|nr:ABC transporter permease [Candidatus Acidoferrum sp.]